jgi:hypothetical protein
MNQNLARLNEARCLQVATAISPLKLSKNFYNRPYLNLDVSEETKYRMHFMATAICHQTHHLHHPGLNLFGWDFIEHVFINLAKDDHRLLKPEYLYHAAVSSIESDLKLAFAHAENPFACSLDRLNERARLMKDAAKILVSKYNGQIGNLFKKSAGRVSGKQGLYSLLPEFEAFEDPQQKKSTLLIKFLEEEKLVTIQDPENFIPIMDYHMQRVLLRLGCVEITNQEYKNKIRNREVLDSDEPIRGLCIGAFKIIAAGSGHPVTKMNDFFWSLGRSCCHETALCTEKVCDKNPCTFTEIVEVSDHSRCVFQDFCPGATDQEYRKLWQPVVETHYY